MKVFISGQKYFGWLVFNIVRELGYDIIGVSAPFDNSIGGVDKLYKSAKERQVKHIIKSGTLNFETMPSGVDLIIAAHSHDFIGIKTIQKTKLGAIGYHPSLLPLHRGRDAIKWTLRMGDKVTGGTVYWLTKNVDGGPIAAQDYCFIPPGISESDLWRDILQPMGVRLITKVLGDIKSGKIIAMPQDNRCATWEPSLSQKPIFRPDLPMIGDINGYEYITKKVPEDWANEIRSKSWKQIAGG